MTSGSVTRVDILDVSRATVDVPRIGGYSVDLPGTGWHGSGYAFAVAGWLWDRLDARPGIELTSDGCVIGQAVATLPRPDVADTVPGALRARHTGFATHVAALDLAPEFEVSVEAILPRGPRVPLGTIRGRRSPLPADAPPGPRPVMLTTLGRTGSTLLAQLLGAHPRIVVHGRFPYETRVGAYWMSVLRTLASPASYVEAVAPSAVDQFWWLGDPGLPAGDYLAGIPLVGWLGGANVEALARFCRERVTAFYLEAAAMQGKAGAAYFAEKHLPKPFVQDRLWELSPGAREVVLVRDPRDMIASILAFNDKRGLASFGRELAATDEEYVAEMRISVEALRQAWRRRAPRACLVRYEDLVLRAPETLRGLLAYLELDHGPGTVDAVLRTAAETAPDLQAAHRTAGRPEASVGRWRHDLSPSLQEMCADAFAPALADFGYAG